MSSSKAPRSDARLGIYYEHPDWYRPLFETLDRRGVPYDKLHADTHTYDPAETESPYAVVFNRMSPSAYTRGRGHLTFYTLQYLAHLERLGVRVVNGYDAWRTEISKAYQLSILERLGLPYPRARVIHHPSQASDAAEGLRFPVVVKPNIGGSGAGIIRFDTPDALARAASSGSIGLGIDSTALVQEYVTARDQRIVRVEVLDGKFLYAIRIYTTGDTFNLCPADVCQGVDGVELARPACPVDAPKNNLRVEAYTPPPAIVSSVERIMAASGIELGGVEYMIDARDGRAYFYDVNALSNFVADGARVLGFDPFVRLAVWLEDELRAATGGLALDESVEPLESTEAVS
jgi:ribosomal protein S6-L-glutamate ligase RimK-like protein